MPTPYVPQAWDNTNPLPTTKAKTADAEFREIKTYLTAIPQRSLTADVTLEASDAGKHYYHPSGDAARTVSIPTNATVPFRIGTAVNFVNDSVNTISLTALAGTTLVKAGSGVQTPISIAQNGSVMLLKVGTDRWFATGVGMT